MEPRHQSLEGLVEPSGEIALLEMRVEVIAEDEARLVISDQQLFGKSSLDTGPSLLNGNDHQVPLRARRCEVLPTGCLLLRHYEIERQTVNFSGCRSPSGTHDSARCSY